MRYKAAIRRLNRSYDPNMYGARDLRRDYLSAWRENAIPCSSWPTGDGHREGTDLDLYHPARACVAALVQAIRGDTMGYANFANDPIIISVVERLLKNRLNGTKLKKRDEIAFDLTLEVFKKLVIGAWLPPPAVSSAELQENLFTFLYRGIPWDMVLGRSESSQMEYRDDLHIDDDNSKRSKGRRRRNQDDA